MNCKHCQAQIKDTAKFCPKCGGNQKPVTAPSQPYVREGTSPIPVYVPQAQTSTATPVKPARPFQATTPTPVKPVTIQPTPVRPPQTSTPPVAPTPVKPTQVKPVQASTPTTPAPVKQPPKQAKKGKEYAGAIKANKVTVPKKVRDALGITGDAPIVFVVADNTVTIKIGSVEEE